MNNLGLYTVSLKDNRGGRRLPRILVVENDIEMSNDISSFLKEKKYEVTVVDNTGSARRHIQSNACDLVLLNAELPDNSSLDFCEYLRKDQKLDYLPIIVTSTTNKANDKVAFFEAGASQYLVKPFSQRMLLDVLVVLLKVGGNVVRDSISFHDIKIDFISHKVTRGNKVLQLSPIEFRLLQLFIEKQDEVIARSEMLGVVWEGNPDVMERSIDVYVARLRKILLNFSEDGINVIKTVRSVGYRMSLE